MEVNLATICDSCGKQFSNVYTLNAHRRQVHENKKPYKCVLCSLSFSTKYKLKRHIQGIHSETRDKFCEVCGHAFKTREMLIKHLRIHFKGPFSCSVCQEIFKYKASYDHHSKKHDKELNREPNMTRSLPKEKHFQCKICFKIYKNLKSLQNHEENHYKGRKIIEKDKKITKAPTEELLTCFVCNEGFHHKRDFENHLTSHEEQYKFDDMIVEEELSDNEIVNEFVEQTEIEYANETNIDSIDVDILGDSLNDTQYDEFKENPNSEISLHREKDTELETGNQIAVEASTKSCRTEKIICDICGMLFLNKSHLRRHHARKHRDKTDYNFECGSCGAKFLLKYDLQRHLIKHNSMRSVECPQCTKRFKTKTSLDSHIKLIHNQERSQSDKQYVCNICSRSYYHKRHLDYHMRKHTDDRRYTCNQCDKSFLYSDAVKWHQIRVHKELAPFICSLCSRKFIHEKTYESHLKDHDSKTGSLAVDCPVCNKKISEKRHLPRHIRTHLKKGFACDYCQESFKERFQLSKHLRHCEDRHNKEVKIIYESIVE